MSDAIYRIEYRVKLPRGEFSPWRYSYIDMIPTIENARDVVKKQSTETREWRIVKVTEEVVE